MIELTGLWEKKDKNGNTFFSGKIGRANVFIFKNTQKEKENQPDYRLMVGEPKKKEDGGAETTSSAFDSGSEIPF